MELFGKEVGVGYPIIVAEISCNHEGNENQGCKLINAAKEADADAVKIQLYTADDMVCDRKYIIQGSLWDRTNLYKLYEKTQSDYALVHELIQYAKEEAKIPIFASVFSLKGLEFLERYSLPCYKIASFEFSHHELIKEVVRTNKPIILSAGVTNFNERKDTLRLCDKSKTILMHCVSAYPTPLCETRLGNISNYKFVHGINVGYSDHTRGITAGPLAVAQGACMLEKHLCLVDTSPEDETFSLFPNEFGDYVRRCKLAAQALDVNVKCLAEEASKQFKRSLYAVEDIVKGELFTKQNVRAMRPYQGLHPCHLDWLIEQKAKIYIQADTPITSELIA